MILIKIHDLQVISPIIVLSFHFFLVSFEMEMCLILMKSSVLIYSFATYVFVTDRKPLP